MAEKPQALQEAPGGTEGRAAACAGGEKPDRPGPAASERRALRAGWSSPGDANNGAFSLWSQGESEVQCP